MNRPSIAQIEAFYWTATLGSVQKAADRLCLSQPAMSLRLKEFEANVGMRMFERSGRSITPTLQAQAFLRNARAVLDSVEALSLTGATSVKGIVKVGFAEGFALTCLPQIIAHLHIRYPEVHPELTVATSSSMEPALHDGRLDLAFLAEPREVEGFTYVDLGLQPTSWVAPTSFAFEHPVTPLTLSKVRVISNQPGTIGYSQVVRWFATEGLHPAQLDICSSVAIQAKLIESATGVGILPSRMIDDSVSAGRLQLITTLPAVQPVAILYVHRTDRLTPAARAVIQCVQETLEETGYLL